MRAVAMCPNRDPPLGLPRRSVRNVVRLCEVMVVLGLGKKKSISGSKKE